MSIKESILAMLTESSGTFLSGEELSSRLAVSRTAVWKAINTLRQEGYPIEAVTNKGYLLLRDDCPITEESLRLCMIDKYKKNAIHLYDCLDSTNNRARQLASEGAPHGTIVMAQQQTGGRGRLGRSFFSPRNGIYLSIIIKPSFDITKGVLVTSATAVAVAESIEEICGKDAGIKWVNDVYVDGKKICGILTEGIASFETGQIESIVVGIGINTSLRGFPDELKDIAGALNGKFSKPALAAAVISKTLDLAETIEDRGFIAAYKKKSLVIGKDITVYNGSYKRYPQDELPSRTAKALDIDKNGGLMVMYADGQRETLISGEISIRL